MIEFGKTLRLAREAKGYTVAQLADMTHIMHQIVEGLEAEDFSRIVAPIYGRGFVKLYCEAVGLDPKPMVAEFMDIYNGNRPAAIRTREVPTAPVPPPASVEPTAEPTAALPPSSGPIATETPPPAADALDLPGIRLAEPAPTPIPPTPAPSVATPDLFSTPTEPSAPSAPSTPRSFSLSGDGGGRFAGKSWNRPADEESPKPSPVYRPNLAHALGQRIPPNLWRILTVVLGAVGVVIIGFIGIRAVYRAATTAPVAETDKDIKDTRDEKTTAATTAKPATAKPTAAKPTAAKPAATVTKPAATTADAKRKPAEVPPLYLD